MISEIQEEETGVYRVRVPDPDILIAFSGREYDAGRRAEFLKRLDIREDQLALLRQVHHSNLIVVTQENLPQGNCSADGMVTEESGIALGVLTADCVPVFFWDASRRVAGITHAGWRGTYHGIVSKMIMAFRQNFASKAENIRAVLGPSIGPCCYEVGDEFSEFFPQFYIPGENSGDVTSKGHMDLPGAVLHELELAGIPSSNILNCQICTACQNKRFFSHRREERCEGRILSVIQMREGR